ncbi:uncharacterized protein [Rutidosis leptorrhynchoides]|uniref:uncharacterized protein n=1 Tax=Rutidosis leptorrhynchoides TaxID=125765 RepID=UPI003A998AC3
MAIVVRFVDREGYVKDRFLDLVHVKDTSALTLRNEILSSLSFHNLDVQDIRGQGYDGASNMRGEWNGLKASILKKNVLMPIMFTCHDQLQDAQISEIAHSVEIGELESGKGANRIQSLQRLGDTRWSSHYRSIHSLLKLYGPAIVVLHEIAISGSTPSQRGDASFALTELFSFDFVIVLHLMKKMMKTTDKLFQSIQRKSQDIVNALSLVSTTKLLIQNIIDQGWQSLMERVVVFCGSNSIQVPEMTHTYKDIIRSRSKKTM